MKIPIYITICFLFLTLSASASQKDSSLTANNNYPLRKVTIEPAIGIETSQMFDLVISNVVQWNIKKRLGIVSYTSYSYNEAMDRNFNYIMTDYNYSLTQKFGIGTSLYTKHTSHTFSFMGGIRYDAVKVTLENPELEKASASVSSVSPEVGLMYNLKIGKKKYFFSYRMYIPFYPYPFKSSDFWAIDGNTANLSLEFGLGIRLK
jgi:hypothetical protein